MSLKLFYFPGSCARASHIALEEASADYEAIRVNLLEGEQRSPAYLAINPKGRVPALVGENGVLTETPAILAYVAQTYPQARLAPLDDPWAFAQAQSFNAYLCATLQVAHSHGRRGSRWADDPVALADMTRKVPETVGACFQLIEDEMLQGPYVLGETYSICDAYLFTVARWMEGDGVDPARFPRVAAHSALVAARPAVIRVVARETA